MVRYLIYAIIWSFSGDSKMKCRHDMGDFIRTITAIPLPPASQLSIIDYEVRKCFSLMLENRSSCCKLLLPTKRTYGINAKNS